MVLHTAIWWAPAMCHKDEAMELIHSRRLAVEGPSGARATTLGV
jgi:hypothetical protein